MDNVMVLNPPPPVSPDPPLQTDSLAVLGDPSIPSTCIYTCAWGHEVSLDENTAL